MKKVKDITDKNIISNPASKNKPKNNGKHPGGRPPKYIVDSVEVEKLASYGVPVKDVGDFFNCPPQVISQSYQQFYTKGYLRLKQQLRMKQIQRAMQGSDTMLIWLGKQILDQREKQDLNLKDFNFNVTIGQ